MTVLSISVIDTLKFLRIEYYVLALTYCVFCTLHFISVIHTLKYYVLRITYWLLSIT